MLGVRHGDEVHVRYTVMFETQDEVRCLDHDMPSRFTVGQGALLGLLERSLLGMQPGEIKLVRVPCTLALGDQAGDLSVELDRDELDELGIELSAGMELLVQDSEGDTIFLPLTEVSGTHVRFNSAPLFEGRDLHVALELLGATIADRAPRPGRRRKGDDENRGQAV